MEELAHELRAFLSASVAFEEALSEVLELHPTDVRCLSLLDQRGTLTAGALAKAAGLTTGAVTFLVDRLERAGYAYRRQDVADRRRVLVELNPAARAKVNTLQVPLVEAWRQSARQFSVEELAVVAQFLRKGREVYEAQAAALGPKRVRVGRGLSVAEGRQRLKHQLKAQARAEALEKVGRTAQKLQARAARLQANGAARD